jgi:gluconolactonase
VSQKGESVKRVIIGLGCACLLGTLALAGPEAQTPSPTRSPNPPAATQQTPGPGRRGAPRVFSLQAISPKFWKLLDKNAKLVTVATGFGFTEGPVWDAREGGFLYVSDEEQNHIYRINADGTKTIVASTGDPDGSTFDEQLRLLTTASVLRAIVRVAPDGTLTTLTDRYQGQRYNSPNDIVMGPDGAYYFTDPTLDLPKGQTQETPFQGVYRLSRDGTVTLLTKDLDEPNGLAFSPDGKRFYVDDTKQRNIRVYIFHDGAISAGRIFGDETPPQGQRGGVPDGMKIDKQGDLFVTGPGGVWVWDSAGNHIGTINLPKGPANLAWGDADYKTLYFTSGDTVYKLRAKIRGFVPYLKAKK